MRLTLGGPECMVWRRAHGVHAIPPPPSMNQLSVLKAALAGRYEIDREIGAGGMATVWLARDVRHDRRVALKLLKPDLAAVVGVERFLTEIRLTANLQHPNLLPLFDSGEADGLLYYVMPYVDGESLRARLDRERQLPIAEAVRIAVAVANALEYAHSRGVIHRDLKPENILLQAGQPVVADFGIALALTRAAGERITQTGLSLGTPQYMSPEQATADRSIDGRSDIYSLGAVTYEMLTGDPPHTGSTAQAVIAHLLTERPRLVRATRPHVPEYVEQAIERSLEKLPADRFASATEFAAALEGRGPAAMPVPGKVGTALSAGAPGWRSRLLDPVALILAAVGVIFGALIATVGYRLTSGPKESSTGPTIRYVLAAPDSARPCCEGNPWPGAISPDGAAIVYTTAAIRSAPLYALRSDRLDAHMIPGTADNGGVPTFSPDGRWIVYSTTTNKLRKVTLDGGTAVTIAGGFTGNGVDWAINDEVVTGSSGPSHGLIRVSAAGGEPVEFAKPDTSRGERDYDWPIALDDGTTIAFAIWNGTLSSARLAVTSLRDGKVTPLNLAGIRPLAFLDGRLVYLRADGVVLAAPLDRRRRRVTGAPVPVLDHVGVNPTSNGNSEVFISRGGGLLTSRGGSNSRIAFVTPDEKTSLLSAESRNYLTPRLSPDGHRIAVVVVDEDTHSAVWIYDRAAGTWSRLSSAGNAISPEWTSDSKRVVYVTTDDHGRAVCSQSVDGAARPDTLLTVPPSTSFTASVVISPDSRSLLLVTGGIAETSVSADVYRIPLDSTHATRPFLRNHYQPRFSPDGRWVALTSGETMPLQVYVWSFPDPAVRLQISTDGATEPMWSADGTKVYYLNGPALIAAKLELSPTPRVVSRDTVMKGEPVARLVSRHWGEGPNYDVSRDGKGFLTTVTSKDGYQLVVVPNWLREFRQRLAAGARP